MWSKTFYNKTISECESCDTKVIVREMSLSWKIVIKITV